MANLLNDAEIERDCILGSGDTMAVTATEYTISSTGEAQCQGHNLGDFTKKEEKRGAAT